MQTEKKAKGDVFIRPKDAVDYWFLFVYVLLSVFFRSTVCRLKHYWIQIHQRWTNGRREDVLVSASLELSDILHTGHIFMLICPTHPVRRMIYSKSIIAEILLEQHSCLVEFRLFVVVLIYQNVVDTQALSAIIEVHRFPLFFDFLNNNNNNKL